MTFPRALLPAVFLVSIACHIETRPPAEVARSQTTIQATVIEHYRARNVANADSIEFQVTRRQVDVRRDLASVWVTLRERRRMAPDSSRDSTRYEHLLLRRIDGSWVVLSVSPVSTP